MYKRVLLKFSGEGLSNDSADIFDRDTIVGLADTITSLHNEGVEIGIVIGGGNICRGAVQAKVGFDRVSGDYMGMLSTVINALAVSSTLEQKGVKTTVFSALGKVSDRVKEYNPDEANADLADGKVCFFAGGIGKPYFTTDTGAATRAVETKCEAILMGKHGVDGVYDKDPTKHSDAQFISTITFDEMIEKGIMVMDQTAVQILKNTDIQIRVFSSKDPSNYVKVAHGDTMGTTCKKGN